MYTISTLKLFSPSNICGATALGHFLCRDVTCVTFCDLLSHDYKLNGGKLQPRMSDPVRPAKRQRSDPSVGESSSNRSKLVMTAERVADAPGDANRMMRDAEPGESVQGADGKL